MRYMLLDPYFDAEPAAEDIVIADEAAFLRHAVDAEQQVLVRGERLSLWAELLYRARGIPFRYAIRPLDEIGNAFPVLSDDQGRRLYEAIKHVFDRLPRPLSAESVLAARFPTGPWSAPVSDAHAAEWLLWLYTNDVDGAALPLLNTMCEKWQGHLESPAHAAYRARSRQEALAVLERWLGLAASKSDVRFPPFPVVEVPRKLLDQLRGWWRRELVNSHGRIAERLRQAMPFSVARAAAQECIAYFKQQPHHLSRDLRDAMQPFLRPAEQDELDKLIPPDTPPAPAGEPSDIMNWFREHYLPYRRWQSGRGTQEHRGIAVARAQEFARWYLRTYRDALLGGAAHSYLSFNRTSMLQEASPTITLLLVMDGLHVSDALLLQQAVAELAPRLSLVSDDLAFAPLPTITRFCKPALIHGVPPARVEQVQTLGEVVKESKRPTDQLANAAPGTVVIWSVLEPDHTYHRRNTHDGLGHRVEAQLRAMAQDIAEVVNDVPDEVPLRIVVTTDHGRLFAESVREVPAPPQMEVHGRTAWGPVSFAFDASGCFVQENVAYLHGDTYGLEQNVAIILDESAFPTIDGRGGSEVYPHGGLFPEEVIVPWMVMDRDVRRPAIEITVGGQGQAGAVGHVMVTAANLSTIPVHLRSLHLHGLDYDKQVTLDWILAPQDKVEREFELELWPSRAATDLLRGAVEFTVARGLTFETEAIVDLETKEMYRQDNILEGLDL